MWDTSVESRPAPGCARTATRPFAASASSTVTKGAGFDAGLRQQSAVASRMVNASTAHAAEARTKSSLVAESVLCTDGSGGGGGGGASNHESHCDMVEFAVGGDGGLATKELRGAAQKEVEGKQDAVTQDSVN